jgi:flavin reductase (DIM6/NTAB) family NADH-FMN oxidoreductase RutF
MNWDKNQIEALGKVERLNLINSIVGGKPANLIGTCDSNGATNVAIFSSVIHLGSNPALLGFILRPAGEIPRNTYENIKNTGYYTINHVQKDFIENAHFTSAKFDKTISEFDACQLTPYYQEGFLAPFVAESTIQIGMKFLQEIAIELNDTIMVIGSIENIAIQNEMWLEEGHLNLEQAGSIVVSGLNTYYTLQKTAKFPYARVQELPENLGTK